MLPSCYSVFAVLIRVTKNRAFQNMNSLFIFTIC